MTTSFLANYKFLAAAIVVATSLYSPAFAQPETATNDPLPSWDEGPSKSAIVEFVESVSTRESPQYVQPVDRIAVFDNDGTLWPENPIPFQLAYAIDEIKRLAPEHPEWKDDEIIQAAISGDIATVAKGGHKALGQLVALSHTGITTEEFDSRVKEWLRTARHPRFGRPYNEILYQPMLEVLAYLRANGFRTYIVSGGGVDFMRVWAEEAYGIPPEQVIGSYVKAEYQLTDRGPIIVKQPAIDFIDDKAGKPVAIHRFIGRRPIACFGNSDGDKEMMEWTTIDHGRSLGVIVHHTDAEREYAYDSHPKSSGKLIQALADAPKRKWVVVDMKNEWKQVFAE